MSEIILPELGEGIKDVEVREVLVKEKDSVKKDDVLVILETDKASMEIPSEVSGKVSKISVKVGDEIKTGQILIAVELDNKTKKVDTPPEIKKEKPELNLHFVGKLQTNKAKDVVKLFDYVHSLENIKQAKALSKYEIKFKRKLKYFIQINV